MDTLSLLEVNKPEKVKEAINELINYKNTAGELPNITAESLGLGSVDNTRDMEKPVSTQQKNYIDAANSKNVKLQSDDTQKVISDILLGDQKKLSLERADGSEQETLNITNENGYETLNVGSANVPLKLRHCIKDINDTIVSKNPKLEITDDSGNVTEDKLALLSDLNALGEAGISDMFISAGTDLGTIKITTIKNGEESTIDNIPVNGLGTAAFKDVTDIENMIASAIDDSISDVLDTEV